VNQRAQSSIANSADVLNRYPDTEKPQSTVHVMKYVFPRQFGLHNVFTCPFNKSEGFCDYTDREEEISQAKELQELRRPRQSHDTRDAPLNIPKRLRGRAFALVKELQRRHRRCPYTELLRYYCPKYVSLV